MAATDLRSYPIHLGLRASAVVEPVFAGALDWYEAYAKRHASDGREGRLVSMHSFTKPWDSWEMHPNGSEVVVCTAGRLTLHQQRSDGSSGSVTLAPGQNAINDPGTWHTAHVKGEATALFITAGMGTQVRPR